LEAVCIMITLSVALMNARSLAVVSQPRCK